MCGGINFTVFRSLNMRQQIILLLVKSSAVLAVRSLAGRYGIVTDDQFGGLSGDAMANILRRAKRAAKVGI